MKRRLLFGALGAGVALAFAAVIVVANEAFPNDAPPDQVPGDVRLGKVATEMARLPTPQAHTKLLEHVRSGFDDVSDDQTIRDLGSGTLDLLILPAERLAAKDLAQFTAEAGPALRATEGFAAIAGESRTQFVTFAIGDDPTVSLVRLNEWLQESFAEDIESMLADDPPEADVAQANEEYSTDVRGYLAQLAGFDYEVYAIRMVSDGDRDDVRAAMLTLQNAGNGVLSVESGGFPSELVPTHDPARDRYVKDGMPTDSMP